MATSGKSYASYLEVLEKVRRSCAKELTARGLLAETGDWLDSAVLKIQKENWMQEAGQGVFFSIWVEGKNLKRLHYNIHALKLRFWKTHVIKPGEFAEAFRAQFNADPRVWPNVQTEFGPQTLMRGWEPLDLTTLAGRTKVLIENFVGIHPIIDRLLEDRIKIEQDPSFR